LGDFSACLFAFFVALTAFLNSLVDFATSCSFYLTGVEELIPVRYPSLQNLLDLFLGKDETRLIGWR